MKHIILLIVTVTFFSTLYGSEKAYKIVVNSYQSRVASEVALKEIRNYVHQHVPDAVQKRAAYDFHSRQLGSFYSVTIEPIVDQELLQQLLVILQQEYVDAFVSNSRMGPQDTVKPEKNQNVLVKDKPIAAEQTSKLDKEERLKKLYEQQAAYGNNNSDNGVKLLFWGALAALIGIGFLVWLLKYKNKRRDTDLSQFFVNEPPRSTKDNVSRSIQSDKPVSKQKRSEKIKIDLHSHLIPGIDDGAKTMDEAIELITKLRDFGYTKLITTPHIASHRYPNTSQIIQNGLQSLREALESRGIAINIEAAAEYYLDDHFIKLLEKGDLLTFGGNFLLFELSYVNHPAALYNMVEAMQQAGYKPVLAHPERYGYMHKSFDKYEKLKKMGVYFQLNMNSLVGYYSMEVKAVAEKLIEKGMVDFIGSDTHKARHLSMMQGVYDTPMYQQLIRRNSLMNNML